LSSHMSKSNRQPPGYPLSLHMGNPGEDLPEESMSMHMDDSSGWTTSGDSIPSLHMDQPDVSTPPGDPVSLHTGNLGEAASDPASSHVGNLAGEGTASSHAEDSRGTPTTGDLMFSYMGNPDGDGTASLHVEDSSEYPFPPEGYTFIFDDDAASPATRSTSPTGPSSSRSTSLSKPTMGNGGLSTTRRPSPCSHQLHSYQAPVSMEMPPPRPLTRDKLL
jgi:hypothetical protein